MNQIYYWYKPAGTDEDEEGSAVTPLLVRVMVSQDYLVSNYYKICEAAVQI